MTDKLIPHPSKFIDTHTGWSLPIEVFHIPEWTAGFEIFFASQRKGPAFTENVSLNDKKVSIMLETKNRPGLKPVLDWLRNRLRAVRLKMILYPEPVPGRTTTSKNRCMAWGEIHNGKDNVYYLIWWPDSPGHFSLITHYEKDKEEA